MLIFMHTCCIAGPSTAFILTEISHTLRKFKDSINDL